MQRYILLLALAIGFSVSAFAENAATDPAFTGLDGDIIAHIHFAGTTQISADPQAAGLKTHFAGPEAENLREHTLEKLSTAPYRFLKSKINSQNTNDFGALLRPLFEDLLGNESYIELRGATNEVPELMLAVKLPNDRAQLWQAYLSTVLNSWTDISVTQLQGDGYTGWELKKHKNPNLIRFIHAGDWVLFGWGQDELHLQPAILQSIKTSKRPVEPLNNSWLDALVDWPAWNAHHPLSLPFSLPLPANLPKLHLSVEGRKDYVRPTVTMLFATPLDLKLDPWKIPSNYIHNPVASFSVARGIGPWLGEIPEVKKLNPPVVPNQMTAWSVAGAPFGLGAVMPVPGASNYLAKLYPAILTDLNATLTNRPVTSSAGWTNGRIKFVMPFVSPYLTSMTDQTGDYLIGCLFPLLPKTNAPPLPQELMHEIDSKANLVYYSWELNSERIVQCESLNQLYRVTSAQYGPNTGSPALRWLLSVRTNLANCGTEITLTAPNELTMVRNAPIGFTGFELIALEFWMDSPGFPLDEHYDHPITRPRKVPPKSDRPGNPGIPRN